HRTHCRNPFVSERHGGWSRPTPAVSHPRSYMSFQRKLESVPESGAHGGCVVELPPGFGLDPIKPAGPAAADWRPGSKAGADQSFAFEPFEGGVKGTGSGRPTQPGLHPVEDRR